MSENKIHLSVYLSYALWRMYGNEKIKMRAIHLEFIIKKKRKRMKNGRFFSLKDLSASLPELK